MQLQVESPQLESFKARLVSRNDLAEQGQALQAFVGLQAGLQARRRCIGWDVNLSVSIP